jgi:hypothetical protein
VEGRETTTLRAHVAAVQKVVTVAGHAHGPTAVDLDDYRAAVATDSADLKSAVGHELWTDAPLEHSRVM